MWYKICDQESPHLVPLMNYAETNFNHHLDRFLHHRDVGMSTLITIITAESTLGGLYFSDKIKPELALTILLAIILISIPLSILSIGSCRRSYRASLEHAALLAKTMWATGLTEDVPIFQKSVKSKIPFINDTSLYTPRYLLELANFSSTEEYVHFFLHKRGNTFYTTIWTLRITSIFAIVFGLGMVLAIISQYFFN
jgi:hypothetical protein